MAAATIWSKVRGFLPGARAVAHPADHARLDPPQLQHVLDAARALQALQAELVGDERSVLTLVMNDQPYAHWRMYPKQGGVLDPRTASQFFYHAHADYTGEHGHFHTFIYHQRRLVHLVAIGMNAHGQPNALYTFNRWGPADTYYPARRLAEFLPMFDIQTAPGLDERLPVFVNGMLRAFRLEIEWLFNKRDETFALYRFQHGGAEPYEDRSLEITSHLPIDLDAHVTRLEAVQRRRRPRTSPRSSATTLAPVETPVVPGARAAAAEDALAQRETEQLLACHRAGTVAGSLLAELRAQDSSLLRLVMGDQPLEHWRMYPWEGGVRDGRNKSQYFYHSHPQTPEHGHFHLFHRDGKRFTHLVALSVDTHGEPMELFTVNRWVTGDSLLPADRTAALVPRFQPRGRQPDGRLHALLRHLLLLYQPEIRQLLLERDASFVDYRATHGGLEPYENRDLEVLSSLPIQPERHVERLAAELRRRGVLSP